MEARPRSVTRRQVGNGGEERSESTGRSYVARTRRSTVFRSHRALAQTGGMTGLVVCVVALAVATMFGLLRAGSDGRMRVRTKDGTVRLSEAELGGPLGSRATLVQFSTAFCQPCRATRRVLSEVAGMVDGVEHVEVDAEAQLELVRRLEIRRTPTVLVLDAYGRVVRRASGQPRTVDVIAALGQAV